MTTNHRFGFVRVAVGSPRGNVGDAAGNAHEISQLMQKAEAKQADVLLLPELATVKYTAKDLLHQMPVLDGAIEALLSVTKASKNFSGLLFLGLPLIVDTLPFNCVAAIKDGKILGIVPKSALPGTKEFEEARFFQPAAAAMGRNFVTIAGKKIPFGTDLLFECSNIPWLVVGAEVCEDGWLVIPPSAYQALSGATLIVNASASNETVTKSAFRRQLFSTQSARYMSGYLYASSGVEESSTDLVFGGDCFVSENGTIIAKNKRFEQEAVLLCVDLDLERLVADRIRTNSFGECKRMVGAEKLTFRRIAFSLRHLRKPRQLMRFVDAHPFVPKDREHLAERCEEIDNIQVAGLAKRIVQVNSPAQQLYGVSRDSYDPFANPSKEHLGRAKVAIGVSGGLDSTRALLVTAKAFDLLGIPRSNILAFTMPGFGTTTRTKKNAHDLMHHLGVTAKEVDIKLMCFHEWKARSYKPFGIDLSALAPEAQTACNQSAAGNAASDLSELTLALFEKKLKELAPGAQDLGFENTQARMRTQVLMNSGFVIGTGTLSELAKGWCTYNADHMSMYNPNVGVPKTLIQFLVEWSANNQFEGAVRATLLDIVGTPMSPELLPTGKQGEIVQKTEDMVGPYELTDFFLYYLLRFGFAPQKILHLAEHAEFHAKYSMTELRHWMRDFIERFFRSQFKRSALPDGPKVGSISLSPRGDWRMPTDACAALFLNWLTKSERSNRITALTRTAAKPPASKASKCKRGDQSMSDCKCAAHGNGKATASKHVDAFGSIDAENDFGSQEHSDGQGNFAQLPVPEGEKISPAINELLQMKRFHGNRFASMEDHPADMFSFASMCPDKKPYIEQVPDGDGVMNTVFPDHCRHGTWGQKHFADIKEELFDRTFLKGTTNSKHPFSVCANQDCIPWLKERGVTRVFLGGLVKSICVGYSAIDFANAGFQVHVVEEATRDLPPGLAYQHVLDEMVKLGIKFVSLADVKSGKV